MYTYDRYLPTILFVCALSIITRHPFHSFESPQSNGTPQVLVFIALRIPVGPLFGAISIRGAHFVVSPSTVLLIGRGAAMKFYAKTQDLGGENELSFSSNWERTTDTTYQVKITYFPIIHFAPGLTQMKWQNIDPGEKNHTALT